MGPPQIHVLFPQRAWNDTVDETGARYVVAAGCGLSDRVTLEGRIAPGNHLILSMDDILGPLDSYEAPGEEHVNARLIDFVSGWDRATPMVVHCFAGISRSSAAAYVAACALNRQTAMKWRISGETSAAPRPPPQPNARIVALADAMLKRDGRMIRAVDTALTVRANPPSRASRSDSISSDRLR